MFVSGMGFTLSVRHGGCFGTAPCWHYFGGGKSDVSGLDEDRWSFFDTVAIIEGMGYKDFDLWWVTAEDAAANVFRRYRTDEDAMELAKYAVSNGHKALLFVETKGGNYLVL